MVIIRVAQSGPSLASFSWFAVCAVTPSGRLAHLVGREKAAELLFTGEVIDADEAKAIGLVGRRVAHDDLMPTALEIAGKMPVTRH